VSRPAARKNGKIRRPRGRPRTAGGLTDALIARQDAMSVRLARQINDILARTIPAEVVERESRFCVQRLRAALVGPPDEWPESKPYPEPLPPLPPDPTLEPVALPLPKSKTLAAARARGALLRSRLIGLQERCERGRRQARG
jgi:hypothetical protein